MKKTFLLLCAMAIFGIGFSQPNNGVPNIVPPSPNAAALGKYVEQPVDMCNGLVKIEIPIYTIKTGTLELPISLSYHSGGIKVDQKQSWVGLGWSLNAGGVLTRSIVGRRDETGLLTHTYPTTSQVYAMTNGDDVFDYLNALANGNLDNESDRYSYTANGISGMFMYNLSGQMFQIPLTDNQITPNPGVSYTVVSDNGTTYIFDVVEKSYNEATGTGWEPTSFYLSQMISPSGDRIYFDYVSGAGYTDYTASFNISRSDPAGGPGGTVYSPPIQGIIHHDGMILQKIRFNGGHVDFTNTNSIQNISEIKVYDESNTLRQSFKLEYTSWSSRTMLNEVKILNNDGSTIGKYSLLYNTAYTMPDYFTGVNQSNLYYGQDRWGYYNGVTTNTTLMTIGPPLYTGADRSINTNYAQAGILTEIKFPTGGKSTFEYESNVAALNTVGGLRIKKIKTYADPADPAPITKNYSYDYGYGGILGYLDAFQSYHYALVEENIGPSVPPGYVLGGFVKDIWASSPLLPMSFNANTAFYANVTETMEQGSTPLGRTDYVFESGPDDSYATGASAPVLSGVVTPRYPFYLINLSWSRGQLKSKKTYKYDGTTDVPIRFEENFYSLYKSATQTTGLNVFGYVVHPFGQSPHNGNPATEWPLFQFFDVQIKTWSKKPTSTVIEEYANGKTLTNTTTLSYEAANASTNPHFNVTKSETVNSKNDAIQKVFQYPANFAGNAIYDAMLAKNMKNVVVKEVEKINTVDSRGTYTHFDSYTGGVSPNTFTMYLPNKVQKLYKGAGFQDEVLFDGYDERGNPKQFHKVNDMNNAYIWDYQKKYPIAEAKNASLADIAYTSFEAENDSWNIGSSNRYPIAAITGKKSYLLDNGNITKSGLDANKKYIVSFWAQASSNVSVTGTQSTIGPSTLHQGWYYWEKIITGVSTITVSGVGPIDELRLYPQGAQMSTFTFDPLLGMTSQVDVGSRITSFIYDGYGRLILIKDQDGRILKKICYNYFGQTENCTLYYNSGITQNYTRNDCGAGTGTSVAYTIPAGKYVATSQTAADAMEAADLAANGPAYANSTGTCICEGEGKALINGVCEFGIRVNTDSYEVPGGQYACVYHYEFSDESWSQNYVEWGAGFCPVF